MGDFKSNVGAVKIGTQGRFEQSNFDLNGEMLSLNSQEQRDIATLQELDDSRLIPNIGDVRLVESEGRIHSPDGETSIPAHLKFYRRRNSHGGVDVECHIPALGLSNEQ